jgi:hypothetical protein
MFLCLEENAKEPMILNKALFEEKLKSEPGFIYLKKINDDKDIPYCLWSDNQGDAFLECLENLKPVEKLQMSFIFNMIETELDHRKNLKRILEPKPNASRTEISNNQVFSFNLSFLLEFIMDLYHKYKTRNSYVLIIANSGNEEKLKFLLEEVFKIKGKYDLSDIEYESDEYKFMVHLGLEKLNFDTNNFNETCRKIKRNLTAIICFDNLTPRSNYLNENLDILRIVFEAEELREKLNVFFTFTGQPCGLEELRKDVLEFDKMFNTLRIKSEDDKKTFLNERAWIFHDETVQDLAKVKFLKYIGIFKNKILNDIRQPFDLVHFVFENHCYKDKAYIAYNFDKIKSHSLPLVLCNRECCVFKERIDNKISIDGFLLIFNSEVSTFKKLIEMLKGLNSKSIINSVMIIFTSDRFDDKESVTSKINSQEYLDLMNNFGIKSIPHLFCDDSNGMSEVQKCLGKIKTYEIDPSNIQNLSFK